MRQLKRRECGTEWTFAYDDSLRLNRRGDNQGFPQKQSRNIPLSKGK